MRLSAGRAILYGGLTAGSLDLLDAFVFFGLRSGAQPVGILQSIAAGWLGRNPARAGGMPTALLGLLTHFLIATIIVAIYVFASRHIETLRKRWIVGGIAYGALAYFVMTYVVVPLSNAGGGITFALVMPPAPVWVNGVIIHALGVGLPAAYFASRVRG